MTNLCCKVLEALQGKTLVSAESLTGGGIGHALTAIAGSSAVYKGGIISYTNWVKQHALGVPEETLAEFGAVSAPVAKAMAAGARQRLKRILPSPSPVWPAQAAMNLEIRWARFSSGIRMPPVPMSGIVCFTAPGRKSAIRP